MNLSPLNQLRRSWRQNGDWSLCAVLLADCKEIYVHNYIDLLLCNETRIGGAWKDGISLACYISIFKHERSLFVGDAASTPNRTLRKRRVDCPFPALGYWIQWLQLPIQSWRQSNRYEQGSKVDEIYIQITLLPIVIMEVPNGWKEVTSRWISATIRSFSR